VVVVVSVDELVVDRFGGFLLLVLLSLVILRRRFRSNLGCRRPAA